MSAIPIADKGQAPPTSYSSDVPLKISLAGLSNMSAALFTNPADLIKVRQQLQSTAKSSNFLTILRNMLIQEGVFSLWKGYSASALREAVYSGIRMGSYDYFKSLAPQVSQNNLTVKLGAGMASGMLGSAIANPADLLKVRMQAYGNTQSMRAHTQDILRTSGVTGFYRALIPTVFRAGLLTSSQLGTYDHSKHFLLLHFPSTFQEGLRTHFIASGMAGFACSAVSAPVDVIKVRLMKDRVYKNGLDVTVHLLKNEGPLAFYKGFFMCWIRLWPHTVISLMIYEQLRRAAGLNPVGR